MKTTTFILTGMYVIYTLFSLIRTPVFISASGFLVNLLHHVEASLLVVVKNADQMPGVLHTGATWVRFKKGGTRVTITIGLISSSSRHCVLSRGEDVPEDFLSPTGSRALAGMGLRQGNPLS